MSVTDTTSGLSLNDILANSSIKTNTSADGLASATNSATGNKALGKDAFLQLLVTQLKNQNPLEPQDNGEFVAQLAQFSSLEGITTLNDTVSGLASNYNSSQALQASSLVGRSVIAPADKAVVDTSKSFSGTSRRTGVGGPGQGQDHRCRWQGRPHHRPGQPESRQCQLHLGRQERCRRSGHGGYLHLRRHGDLRRQGDLAGDVPAGHRQQRDHQPDRR